MTLDQSAPAVASDADGDFVVAWTSLAQDGSGNGVFGRRFQATSLFDIDGNGELTALTDGLLILRFFFGFTGNTLVAGAIGAGCTRCDGPSVLAYLESLT